MQSTKDKIVILGADHNGIGMNIVANRLPNVRASLVHDQPKYKVVFVNGIFDILHPGHIQLFKFAKSLGDKLIVGINSDRATRVLKGEERPINDQENRKFILESLNNVDEVIIFDDVRTGDIVQQLKPDILVRGDDQTIEQIRRTDRIPPKVEIKLFPMVGDFSTTNVIKRIRKEE